MKKTALTVLKVCVSIGLYAYIFSKIDIAHLWSILQGAAIPFFLGGVVVYSLIQAISAYRWSLLLQPLGLRTRYPKLLKFYFLGMFFNNFMPTAIGGDVVRVYYLKRQTGRLGVSTISVFLDRDLGMAALLLVATVVASVAGTQLNDVPLAPVFALVGAGFVAANLALFYRPSYNLLHRLLKLFRMKEADERVERLFVSFSSYRGRWRILLVGLLLSIGVQFGCVIVNLLSARAIGLTTRDGWIDFLVFIPAIGLISMVPVSLNGLGWREVSYLVLFQSVGATEPQAAALAFLWLGVLVVTSLPGGILYLLRAAGATEIPPAGEILDKSKQPDAATPSRA